MRRRLIILLGALAATTGIAVAAMTRTSSPPTEPAQAPRVEAPAPASPPAAPRDVVTIDKAMKDLDLIRPARQKLADDFTLKTPEGATLRLSEQRGKVVLVNFWATWCPPCKEEMPAMQRLHERYGKDGFVLIAVSLDADPRVVRPFIAEHRFTFTVALDSRMDVANAYGVRALPASFIVDRDGTLAAMAIGPRQWDGAASRALVAALAR
jgi:peroxiredoxin